MDGVLHPPRSTASTPSKEKALDPLPSQGRRGLRSQGLGELPQPLEARSLARGTGPAKRTTPRLVIPAKAGTQYKKRAKHTITALRRVNACAQSKEKALDPCLRRGDE